MSSEPKQEEEAQPIQAEVKGGKIVVKEKRRIPELEELGYGTKEAKALVLRDYEALYLIYSKKLDLKDASGHDVGFQKFAESMQEEARDSWTRFVIYRDLRARGYVVREGFGFGTDLRVYERGDYPKKAAQYVVFALDEGIERKVDEIRESVKELTKMGKEAIIAVIERRGEVIYYKVAKARF